MTEFTFVLGTSDTERLFALKAEQGKADMTGNDFARELLEQTIHRLHPEKVEYDENTGERIPRKR